MLVLVSGWRSRLRLPPALPARVSSQARESVRECSLHVIQAGGVTMRASPAVRARGGNSFIPGVILWHVLSVCCGVAV